MKKTVRIASLLIAFALLLGSVICIAGETTKITKDVYRHSDVPAPDENGIISDMNSFLPSAGLKVSWLANHGGGQTRMVYTKSGVYYSLFTGENPDAPTIGIDLIHIEEDGSARSVYHTEQPYNPSGPMVSVMADEAGTVWMYAGWGVGGSNGEKFQFVFNMWKYDPATGKTEQYTKQQLYKTTKICTYGSGGYSTCAIDEQNGRIFAVVNCCDKPGYMEWSLFDMKTCEWSEMHAVKLDYRYCYTYILPDGRGGYHLFNQRDVVIESIKTDNGKNVGSAARSLHSCWYDNNMLFDEYDYFHIPDPNVDEIDVQFAVEPAKYEVEKGMYPDNRTNSSDIFMDSKGYLHFILEVSESIEVGHRVMHYVYDVSGDAPVEIRCQKINFVPTTKEPYFCRCYEDTEGNFYLVCVRTSSLPVEFEIWGAADPTAELGLLYAEYLRDSGAKTPSGTAMASSRNGSIMGDIMHWCVNTDECLWYDMTIDFAKLRAFVGR